MAGDDLHGLIANQLAGVLEGSRAMLKAQADGEGAEQVGVEHHADPLGHGIMDDFANPGDAEVPGPSPVCWKQPLLVRKVRRSLREERQEMRNIGLQQLQ